MNAHLLFEADTGHGVALTGLAISIDQEFRHEEQGHPA